MFGVTWFDFRILLSIWQQFTFHDVNKESNVHTKVPLHQGVTLILGYQFSLIKNSLFSIPLLYFERFFFWWLYNLTQQNGAASCTSELTLYRNGEMLCWDRGYNEEGVQVWNFYMISYMSKTVCVISLGYISSANISFFHAWNNGKFWENILKCTHEISSKFIYLCQILFLL